MLIENVSELVRYKDRLKVRPGIPRPMKVLMGSPEHFDVTYAINPFMTDSDGNLKKVDRELAQKQWQNLRDTYLSLGLKVEILPGPEGFQDFVFCANQSFPYWDERLAQPAVIMSQMRSDFRKEEVKFFGRWYHRHDYHISKLSNPDLCLEGNGDALLHPGQTFIWGGVGSRTDRDVYLEVTTLTRLPVVILQLVDPKFYHLDTCFSVLNEETVVVQPKAFSAESLKMIKQIVRNVIETDAGECEQFFTGNCHSPNGKDVILQPGATAFDEKLQALKFNLHHVDTSEFMKSGGSVFCMKMMCF